MNIFSCEIKWSGFFKAGSLSAFLLVCAIASAQEATRVVAENAKYSTQEKTVVLLKWYSKELFYDEGVNIYRKAEDELNWEKINEKPVVRKAGMTPAALASDPDLEAFITIIQTASKTELQQDMLLLNIVLKSFQSDLFSDFMGIYFEDRRAQAGKRYEYRINKLRAGREYLVGVSPFVEAGAYKPGAAVTGLTLAQNGLKIDLNWKHEEDRYYAVNVYRKSSADSVAIKLNKDPLMLSQVRDSVGNIDYPKPMFSEDRNLEQGNSYTYQLAGVGFFNNETVWSDPVVVSFKDITPPPSPQNLAGKADSMNVYLSWENREAIDMKGISVYRSVKSDGPYQVIHTPVLDVGTSLYHDSLQIPGPYYYFVAAVDTAGNEAHSNLIFVEVQDVMPPVQPQQLAIKTDTGRISLTWKMGDEPDLAGYYIYRTVDKNQKKNYVLLNAEPLHENHFDQKLPKNVKNSFFYFVIAVDTSFNRSKPSEVVSGAMPDILPPEKPFIKNISYAEENIIVEWTPNVDHDLTGYHVYRADTTRKFSRVNINILGKSTFRYADRDNLPNTDYFYYLVAMDSAGNVSKASNEVYARRTLKPEALAGQISLKIKYSKRKKRSQLNWNYNTDAAILGYVVFKGEQENRLRPITGLIQSKNFVDRKAGEGNDKEQYYQIRAYAGDNVIYSSVIRQKL